MKIACIGYRDWALNIYDRLAESNNNEYLIVRTKENYKKEEILSFKPDLVLFYGWSWIIDDDLLSKYTCLMLHPSALPKYRGGSPIQNQIIKGEKTSKVTVFIMTNELDAGDIVAQSDFDLTGSLDEIFQRIENAGVTLTQELISNGINPTAQDHSKATYCKRRKPEDSEITIDEILNQNAEYLYDKIRMLADPYPNAYFRTCDGKKLIIKSAEITE